MNTPRHEYCERFEAMMTAWFDDGRLPASERDALTEHLAGCPSCRESFELSARMEEALVSRRAEVPAVDAFLPRLAARPVAPRHSILIAAFRAVMSPAGIAAVLVTWSTMLALHFREPIARVFAWSSSEHVSALVHDVSNLLLTVSGGDGYTLVAIYVVLTLVVLGSTGAITMKYIRHS